MSTTIIKVLAVFRYRKNILFVKDSSGHGGVLGSIRLPIQKQLYPHFLGRYFKKVSQHYWVLMHSAFLLLLMVPNGGPQL